MKPLVIIHGWSDHAATFEPLARLCAKRRGLAPRLISLADYISLDDAVRYDDLVAALEQAWCRHDLPRDPKSVDAIVHSTGGLVIRDWLQRYFSMESTVLDHLVMLAPANFGSPLAHQGQAMIGRLLKGFGHPKPFEVGQELLKGLELASPYSTSLAMLDRFAPNPYHAEGTKVTVFVGNARYGGLAAVANRPGTDGTVRLSNANMNAVRFSVDFTGESPLVNCECSQGQTAFAILPGLNHRSITGVEGDGLDPVFEALEVQDQDFDAWCQRWQRHNQAHCVGQGAYQSTVMRVQDQYGVPVPDYFVGLTHDSDEYHELTCALNEDCLTNVHAYGGDSSYRSFLFNAIELKALQGALGHLHVAVAALPELSEHSDAVVGYPSPKPWVVRSKHLAQWVQPNQTVLVDVVLKREAVASVFALHGMP